MWFTFKQLIFSSICDDSAHLFLKLKPDRRESFTCGHVQHSTHTHLHTHLHTHTHTHTHLCVRSHMNTWLSYSNHTHASLSSVSLSDHPLCVCVCVCVCACVRAYVHVCVCVLSKGRLVGLSLSSVCSWWWMKTPLSLSLAPTHTPSDRLPHQNSAPVAMATHCTCTLKDNYEHV